MPESPNPGFVGIVEAVRYFLSSDCRRYGDGNGRIAAKWHPMKSVSTKYMQSKHALNEERKCNISKNTILFTTTHSHAQNTKISRCAGVLQVSHGIVMSLSMACETSKLCEARARSYCVVLLTISCRVRVSVSSSQYAWFTLLYGDDATISTLSRRPAPSQQPFPPSLLAKPISFQE